MSLFGLAVVIATALFTTAPAAEGGIKCLPPSGERPDATRVVTAETAERLETTQYLGEDFYEVTRCQTNGELIVTQVVGPLAGPDGEYVQAVVSDARVLESGEFVETTMTYADAKAPEWEEMWRRYADNADDQVIPPTAP